MTRQERISSCIRELKSGDRFSELEQLLGELENENKRLKAENERYREEAARQRAESEKLLNLFMEQIKQREYASTREDEIDRLKIENDGLKAELENAKGMSEAKERYEAEYKKLLGIGEILESAADDAVTKATSRKEEARRELEETKAEKQGVEEEIFRLKKQRDEIKSEYENTRAQIEELMAGMRSINAANEA